MSEIKTYRKRPIVIEAARLPEVKNDSYEEIREWIGDCASGDGSDLLICTLEGDMRASPGDWIIKGVSGEFYPCKDEIFRKTHEEA